MKRSVHSHRSQEEIMQHCITRTIRVVLLVTLVLLGGTAGGQTKTEITFWHAMEGQLGEAVEELVKQFNQSQGEVEVKALYKGTYPEVLAATMAAYRRQQNPPNIVQVSAIGTQSMVLSDAIVPVYRLMKQQKIAVDWSDFIETVSDYYEKGGKLYSMPFNVSAPILYYNKDIFRKARLGDAPPVTWRDVETASRKILAGGAAKCGFTTPALSWAMIENTFPWHNQPFATNQNGYASLDTKLLINSDFGLMHVAALARWHKENIFFGPKGTMDQFINGDCAMLLQPSAFIGDFKKSLTFDWGTGQLPHWGPPYPKANTSLGGASLWVLRGHQPADDRGVAQFLKFITDLPQQRWLAATTGWMPITKAAVKSLEDASFYKQHPGRWTAMSQVLHNMSLENKVGLRLGNYVQVREVIELELGNIFTGKKTVKQGLDVAVSRGNAILRQFGVSHAGAASGEI